MHTLASADLVIIGAGIQGTSIAYHLARKGMTDVIVLEMNTIGSGSSGRSASMITYHSFQETRLDLIRISGEAYRCFEAELGADPGYEPIGSLRLVGEEQARKPPYSDVPSEFGTPSQILEYREIERLVPGLALDDIAFGLYNEDDGHLDPHSIYSAYATTARRLGTKIIEGVKATGLKVQQGRVIAVKTTEGTIGTPRVVNAAGFRARYVGSWANLRLPIVNLKRHIFYITQPQLLASRSIPFVHDLIADWYFRQEGKGLIMGMGETPSDEENPKVDWSFLEEMIEQALYRAPALAEQQVIRGWAGLRSVTPDGNPILGEAPALSGFFNCCGWGGHGVMHAPAGGLLTAELIVDNGTTSGDITPFRVERFDDISSEVQNNNDNVNHH